MNWINEVFGGTSPAPPDAPKVDAYEEYQRQRRERRERITRLIDTQLARDDLTTEDVLRLVIADRLHAASDNIFARAVSGSGLAAGKPPLGHGV